MANTIQREVNFQNVMYSLLQIEIRYQLCTSSLGFPQITKERSRHSIGGAVKIYGSKGKIVGPITMERRHIGVKLPILGEINKEAGSPIGLYAILYTFLLYLELLILMYIKSSSCSQEEQLRQVNTRNSSTYLTHKSDKNKGLWKVRSERRGRRSTSSEEKSVPNNLSREPRTGRRRGTYLSGSRGKEKKLQGAA